MGNERIRAVVDLRSRAGRRDADQRYTRDGIEVTSNVFAVFTTGNART